MKSIVITGSSSGIGMAVARYFAGQGWRVAATMRKPENETELNQIEGISLYALDVTDATSVAKATKQILDDFGAVDVVLNNAGYAAAGPFEAATPEQTQRQFDTNVIGLMRVTQAFLPHFRANQAGLFLNVSSIGGRVAFPFISLYHGTKWAVEGFSESLSYELGEEIFKAATDGKPQLRYLIGPDAEQTYAMREQVGDDAFVAGIRQRMLA